MKTKPKSFEGKNQPNKFEDENCRPAQLVVKSTLKGQPSNAGSGEVDGLSEFHPSISSNLVNKMKCPQKS